MDMELPKRGQPKSKERVFYLSPSNPMGNFPFSMKPLA
jgi:hypothetical protein